MTVRSAGKSSSSSDWNPAANALWRNRVESIDDTHPTSIVLRHPGTPYAEVIPDTTEAVLFEVGRRYVERANERAKLGIPPAWIAALRDPQNRGRRLVGRGYGRGTLPARRVVVLPFGWSVGENARGSTGRSS